MKLLGSRWTRWFPSRLAHRFALVAAALAAVALVVTTLASWWLINEQHDQALKALTANERQFRAATVGADLNALASRMTEIAASTILATGLVDSIGRETYLGPFLDSIRQINGIRVQVMFTDFQGNEIASNSGARFSPEQLAWLRGHLETGQAVARVFTSPQGNELVAIEPLVYPRTSSPEGAVFYKVDLSHIKAGPGMSLAWGTDQPHPKDDTPDTLVPSPKVFEPLRLRLHSQLSGPDVGMKLQVPYLHIWLISLTLFSAVVLVGMLLARLLTLDLQRLEAFSRQLFGSGLRTERAPEGGSHEVASLAQSINDMLDRLHEQHADLLREREKLTALTEVLQAADRNKDNFLAMLGHELRNPLSPIRAGAELLRRIPDTDPRVLRTCEMISRQVGHMTKIINDLLDVSRVTRGMVTLENTELELAEIISGAVEQVRPLMEARQHHLTVTVAPEPITVMADRARLIQVLSNLLANAANYTKPGGQVWVEVTASPTEAVIKVQDNGVGIAPDLMPEIFDLFTQGKRASDRREGGLGLGLALVKHLVALHGGTVAAASPGMGQGAVFTVRLPRLAASQAIAPTAMPVAATTVGKLRILVVDDNVDAAHSLAQVLSLDGHSVEVSHDGPSALALARTSSFDAFILDIGLPGMAGTELARRLRTLPSGEDALLIALTGYGQVSDRQKSAEASFDHHLVKPADCDALQRLLGDWAHARQP
ncbi:ATP-binding protein [Aquabacterium sp.]|uniref:hybrid sensor histidine kinase/response regulator n=1 Tax=Aquabacterium sp. TaxID=1872578 RepID=UPI002486FF0B|nr:ATP-binding protein [Aquabacterium sp.]MDI1258115.1 ATP-binding protein [Aquabacterium sp.]